MRKSVEKSSFTALIRSQLGLYQPGAISSHLCRFLLLLYLYEDIETPMFYRLHLYMGCCIHTVICLPFRNHACKVSRLV